MTAKQRYLSIYNDVIGRLERSDPKMEGVGSLGRIETKKLGFVALVGCLLGPIVLLSLLKRTLPPTSLVRKLP